MLGFVVFNLANKKKTTVFLKQGNVSDLVLNVLSAESYSVDNF